MRNGRKRKAIYTGAEAAFRGNCSFAIKSWFALLKDPTDDKVARASSLWGGQGHPCLPVKSTGKMPVVPTARMAMPRPLGFSKKPSWFRIGLPLSGVERVRDGSYCD